MSLINFPNIPNVPGVPELPRIYGVIPTGSEIFVIGVSILFELVFGSPKWGVYKKDGKVALAVDTVLEIGLGGDSRISNYPVERGGFASYNKVNMPEQYTIRLAKSGDTKSRATFLETLGEMVEGIELFDIYTPEKNYIDCNLTGYSLRRSAANGVSNLDVEVRFMEVMQALSLEYSEEACRAEDVKEPASASPIELGQVQLKKMAENIAQRVNEALARVSNIVGNVSASIQGVFQ
ncbi:MAG: hypothetical protein LBK01_06925 [Burkholderiaceae bacterium]|nr:hypothetical protein [Burkholderiaceae bacterium]